jgi:hypothetical protein
MSAPLFYGPKFVALDANGDPIAGALLYTYVASTLTDQATYQDDGLTTPHANPVVADAGGTFDPIFLDNLTYRMILKTSAGVEVWDVDDITPFPATGLGSGAATKSGSYALIVGDRDKFLFFDATATATLPLVADAGEGWVVSIINGGSGVVTVDGNGAETINDVPTITLAPNESAILTCDGSQWIACVIYLGGKTVPGSYTVIVTDNRILIKMIVAGTITLPSAATAGVGWNVSVELDKLDDSSSSSIVPDGTDTIDGRASINIGFGQRIELVVTSASAWSTYRGGGSQTKVKTANETVNNSDTLQDDDDLNSFILNPNIYYKIEGYLIGIADASADLKLALTFTQTPGAFGVTVMSTTPGGTQSFDYTSTGGDGLVIATQTGADQGIIVKGGLRSHATLPSAMKLQWSQNAADASDATLFKGSWLEITPTG